MGSRLSLRPPEPRVPIATRTNRDAQHLAQTLALAQRGAGHVGTDPLVGALVVDPRTQAVIGRGFHATFGGPHAEPPALADAGPSARGATLYCNLEPCGYDAPQKRQPPCTAAIITAGIARVVVGQVDPHPRVRGTGLEHLRAAGVEVDVAPDPRPFWLANAAYVTAHALGRPLDPRLDLQDGRPTEAWFAALEAEPTLRPWSPPVSLPTPRDP